MMNPGVLSDVDCCRLCGFVFVDKRRKRNISGEFAEKFEKVVGEKILEGDKRAVCDTCRYRVEKSWKSGRNCGRFARKAFRPKAFRPN